MANTSTPDEQKQLFMERVDLRTSLWAFVLAMVGLSLLVSSRWVDTAGYHRLAAFMQEGGAALFIAMVLALVWDFAGKRAFADEILAKANMSRDLANAGISLIAESFKDERIRWDELFRNACSLDIYVAYASTWRNTQVERIEKLLSQESARIRVVLPDQEDAALVQSLALRFEMTADAVQRVINEAKDFFLHRSNRKGKVENLSDECSATFFLLPLQQQSRFCAI
jgi:hypothetical protein